MKWLDKIDLTTLLIPGILLALAPFVPEPHLVEKLRMLFQGNLVKTIDIFDLLMHGSVISLVIIKLTRQALGLNKGSTSS